MADYWSPSLSLSLSLPPSTSKLTSEIYGGKCRGWCGGTGRMWGQSRRAGPGRGYRKLNLIETVNKRMTVHLCVSHKHKTAGHTSAGNTLRKKAAARSRICTQPNTPLVKKKRQTNNSHLIASHLQQPVLTVSPLLVTTTLHFLAKSALSTTLVDVSKTNTVKPDRPSKTDPRLSPNGGAILLFSLQR